MKPHILSITKIDVKNNECTFNTVGIVVTLLLIVGTGVSTILLNSIYAPPTATLGGPF